MEFKRWVGERRDVLGLDTESGGLRPEHDRLRMVQFGDLHTGWAIPWELWGGVALEILRDYRGPYALHNSSFDYRFLKTRAGWQGPWSVTDDTYTEAHLVDPGRPKGLKSLASRLVDPRAMAGQQLLDKAMLDNKWTWDTVPWNFPWYWMYAALDPVLTCHIHEKLKPQVAALGSTNAYALEMSAVRICSDMMLRGIRIDTEYCLRNIAELRAKVEEVRSYAKDAYGIDNMTSNKQVTEYLEKDGVELWKRTKSGQGWALDKEVLDWLTEAIQHPLAKYVSFVRRAEKICGSYLDHFVQWADRAGFVHANINPLGAVTSRMAVTGPAFQTLFRAEKPSKIVRGCIIPREGNVLISTDMDQIEARLMAIYSGDQGLIDAFNSDKDFFCEIATQLWKEDIKKGDHRRTLIKNVIYGKDYGAGPTKMANTAGVPEAIMLPLVESFDGRYPGVRKFFNDVLAAGRALERTEGVGYVVTPYGRRIPNVDGRLYALTNYLIQGAAAEILKKSLADLDAVGLGEYLILPVHDEIVLDVPKEQAQDVVQTLKETLNDYTSYPVPLTWSAEVFEERWGPK